MNLSDSDTRDLTLYFHAELMKWQHHKRQLRAVRRDAADGYPSQSMAEGSPRNELDDDGRPLPQHPDPTARSAIARSEGQSGKAGQAERQGDRDMLTIKRLLESMNGRARNVLEPPQEPPVPQREEMCLCCTNAVQATEQQLEQRTKRWGRAHIHPEFCDWCATFFVLHGRRPPKRLLDLRQSGKRIYDKDVREALAS